MPLLPAPKEMHTVPGVSPARGFTATNAGPFAEERLALRSLGALSVQADGLYYAVIAAQADATLPDLPAVLRRPGREEGFFLSADEGLVCVLSAHPRGVLYGLHAYEQTLADDGSFCGTVIDYPDTAFRAFHMDMRYGFPSVSRMLAILEDIGYMARIAFIMDRIFRKFGLSGKSFIPVLVGTGCGVPGVMASRTIENERDRRMTIMTTCFIPCGAKMPIIGLIAGAMFGGSSLVAVSAYFIGMAAIICSGVILKKTKLFAGDPAPFVMELPAYHVPAWSNVFRATWERGWSFIKRAGSVILAATVVLWFLQGFGFENGVFGMVEDQDNSVLAAIATKVAWIFAPLGFGNWRATVASVSGLIAKENVVGTFGVLYHFGGELSENGDEIWAAVAQDYTALSAYAFMIFNLLCAPCFAAMGAIKREMNNGKWTAIAIGYMCALAYCAALVVYQLGGIITGEVGFNFFTIVAAVVLVGFIYLLVRPNKYAGDNEVKIDISKI